ncbi:MAG: M28 family peptidase [Candidatus Aminicenantes bacterium]|nr:M28 family peptidase [Candidatus Aminicenantes bacterium]
MSDRKVMMRFHLYRLNFMSMISILLLLTLPVLSRESKKNDALDTITGAELKDHIYYLASDFLEGRLTGSEGYKQASHYIASQLKAAGLVPFIKNAEGKESYLQSIDFMISSIAPESTIHIKQGQKEITVVPADQFLPLLHGQAFKDGRYEGNPVFVGYGIEEPDDGWNDYENMDISGKIAVMITGAPTKDGKPVLSEEKNELYGNLMQGASERLKSALNHKPAGIIMVLDSKNAEMWPGLAPTLNRPARRLSADEKKDTTWHLPIFVLHPEAAVELLKETGFDPVSGKGEVRSADLKDTAILFDLKYKIEREFACRNVVGFIQGNDPHLKNEYVVVGAHLDHLGVREGNTFNGADDNASGCAAILEAAEATAMSPQRRSVFFVFYTAEEGAGQGSFHFVDNFPFPLENIGVAINVDMVGRNCEPFPGSLLGISPDNLKLELAEFMEKANMDIANIDLRTYLHESDLGDYWGGSDEMMFHMRGIPAVLITSGYSHPDYHKASDDPDKINYDKVVAASRLIYALAISVANAEKIF